VRGDLQVDFIHFEIVPAQPRKGMGRSSSSTMRKGESVELAFLIGESSKIICLL
jgi:hypothetical protein